MGINDIFFFKTKRFAVKATLIGQHYVAQELVTPTNKEFNKKNLFLAVAQLRYNFWKEKGFVSTYVQTKYAFRQFASANRIKVNRWEVITLGETLYFPEKIIPNLSIEAAIAMEMDNLNRKKAFPILLAFNNYLGKSN